MGVRGLTTFIIKNKKHLKKYELFENKLIIDGNNVLYGIYEKEELNTHRDSKYFVLLNIFKDFKCMLEKCNVKPIFVFDGGHVDKRKFPAIKERREAKINDEKGKSEEDIFLTHIMLKILRDLGICTVWCDFEADIEIAKIATEYKCPVLSRDSDFYLMDLPNGFINYLDFNWKEPTERGIQCKIYYRKRFWEKLGVVEECIPYVAALVGNDFIPSQRTVDEAFDLLKGQESVGSFFKNFIKEMNSSVSCYVLPGTSSALAYLDNQEEPIESVLSSSFPPWFINLYRKRGICKFSLDVVLHQYRFLSHNVDSRDVSLSLRKLQYGVLINNSESIVKEYQPSIDSDELIEVNVQPTTEFGSTAVPSIQNIRSLSDDEREKLFFIFLESDKIECKNKELHLPIAAFKFFLKHRPEIGHGLAVATREEQAFSLWMIILKHAMSLNQLLKSPIFEFDVTIIHNEREVFSQLIVAEDVDKVPNLLQPALELKRHIAKLAKSAQAQILIFGNSICEGIIAQKFHRTKSTKVYAKRGAFIADVQKMIEDTYGENPEYLILQAWTNNTTFQTAEECHSQAKILIETALNKYPASHIIVSGVLPRLSPLWGNRVSSKLNKIFETNCQANVRISFVDHVHLFLHHANRNILKELYKDNVRLNNKGLGILVVSLRAAIDEAAYSAGYMYQADCSSQFPPYVPPRPASVPFDQPAFHHPRPVAPFAYGHQLPPRTRPFGAVGMPPNCLPPPGYFPP